MFLTETVRLTNLLAPDEAMRPGLAVEGDELIIAWDQEGRFHAARARVDLDALAATSEDRVQDTGAPSAEDTVDADTDDGGGGPADPLHRRRVGPAAATAPGGGGSGAPAAGAPGLAGEAGMIRPLLLMPLLAACAVEPDRMVLRSPGGSGGSGGDTGTCAVHGFGDRVDWTLPATGVSLRGLTDLTCSGPDDELHVVADLTGDRAPDLIRISDCERASGVGSAHWWVHENVGDGFAADPLQWPLPALSEPYPFQKWSDSFCDADVDHLFAVRDLTGDHQPDLVLLSDCDPASELGRSEWWVYENRGDGFASAPVVWAAPSDVGDEEWGSLEQVDCRGGTRDLYGLHDLDGDDAPELVRFAGCLESGDFDDNGTWTVWRNQGDGFASAPEVWTLPTDAPGRWDGIEGQNCKGEEDHLYVTRDLTGDGVLDLVVSSFCDTDPRWDERWWVYPGTGAGFEAPVDWPIPEHRAPGAWQYLLGRDCVTPTDSKGGLIDLDGTPSPTSSGTALRGHDGAPDLDLPPEPGGWLRARGAGVVAARRHRAHDLGHRPRSPLRLAGGPAPGD